MKIETIIEKPVYGGEFISHFNDKTVFTRFVLDKEKVSSNVYKKNKNIYFSDIDQILEPSPERIQPDCPLFSKCGGCSYLHTTYENELSLKINIFKDTAHRLAKINIDNFKIEIIHGDRFNYRTIATVKSNGKEIGFYQHNTNKVIPFPKTGCLLLRKELNDYILNHKITKNMKIAIDKNDNIITGNNDYFEEDILNIRLKRKLDNFFQVNEKMRIKLINEISNLIRNNIVDSSKYNLADLGCGIGFFSLALSDKFNNIIGYDNNRGNIKSAVKNKKSNNIKNVFFYEKDMSEYINSNVDFEVLLIDPPRAGINRKTLNTIKAKKHKHIIYVSCNPATWARDIKEILQDNYSLKEIKLIDMFPGTHHIEIISLLSGS